MKWKAPNTWHRSNIWLLLCMVGIALSSGRLSLAAPAWFVPFLGIRYMRTNPNPLKARFFRLSFVAWIALSATWYGATPIWGLAHFVFMAFNAAFTILPFAVYDWLRRRLGDRFWSTLLFAAATVALEWLTVNGSPFGSFGAAAYSQSGFLALLQFLSVGGMLSITFLIAWTGAVLDWVVEAHKSRRRFAPALALWAVVLTSVIGWGAVRLASVPDAGALRPGQSSESEPRVLVAGLTAHEVTMHELMPILEEDLFEFRQRTVAIHREYLEMTRAAAEEGVDLIVWPELAGTGTAADVAVLLERAGEIASAYNLHIAVAAMEIDPDGTRKPVNQLTLLGPDGGILARHVKFGGNFMEGTLAGDRKITTVETSLGRVGLAICWDYDFTRTVAETGRNSVDLMIVPAADWEGINPLHGRMAVFRAIENGHTLVRQAQNGLSIVADPYGRVVDTGTGPANAIQAIVWSGSVETIYPHITIVVGLLCTLAAVAAGVGAFVQTHGQIERRARGGR